MSDQVSDEIEITLRSPVTVGRRMVVLATLCRRAFLESKGARKDLDEGPDAERFDLRMWLHDNDLDDELIPDESRVLDTKAGQLPDDDAAGLTWNSEALMALSWAVEMIDTLPDPTRTLEPNAVIAAIPAPWDDPKAWITSVILRDEIEIANERERAEIWVWRAEVEFERRESSGHELRELERDIADVVRESNAAGLLSTGNAKDFTVDGRLFRDLSVEAVDSINAIASIRLHALNWLCGFGADWDDVPLEID